MNKQLALQIKESVLDILSWTNNPNRKLSLECINEIAEQILQDVEQSLRAEEQEDRVHKENINWCSTCDHHLSKCRCPDDQFSECAGSCENCECTDLGPSETVKE